MTLSLSQWLLLIPAVGGTVFAIMCLWTALRFCARPQRAHGAFSEWPPATILKPVCGLEKNLRDNLRTACLQDYPEFQVVFSVQDPKDPAIPILRDLQQEFGRDRVAVAIENHMAGANGKINHLLGRLPYAHY